MNHRYNSHYQATHEKIQEIFLDLASRNKDVSVKQLCAAAGINRSTFYQHYNGFGALMDEIYETRFKGLIDLFFSDAQTKAQTPLSFESFHIICGHIYDNRDFYRIFLNTQEAFPISVGFDRLWKETFLPYYHSIGIGDEKIMLHRFICIQAAFTNTVKYWVNNECSISVDEIAEILSECLHL